MRNPPESAAVCRLCGGARFAPCLTLREPTPAAPDAATYRVDACEECGLLQSRARFPAPPPLVAGAPGEEPHRDAEIALILSHARPRSTVEFGGDGAFARALAARGAGRAARAQDAADETHDLVVARRVVETCDDYPAFFARARALCAEGGHLFLDAPDTAVAFAHGDCTALRRERTAFFTEATLLALLEREGFAAVAVARYDVAGGTLAVLARRSAAPGGDAREPDRVLAASAYGARVREDVATLDAALAHARERGYETVVYGAARAAEPLLALGLADRISYLVDEAPALQGTDLPGTGLRVYGPAKLEIGGAPLVCLLAAERREEARIRARLREELARECVFVGLCAPGDPSGDVRRLAERLGADAA